VSALGRTRALLGKELLDIRRHPTVFLPAVIIALAVTSLPVFVTVVVPRVTGEALSESNDFEEAIEAYRRWPEMQGLDIEALVQASMFQYFLLLLVLAPITSSIAVASDSIVSEKQARALEPLLATPITTAELLAAKVLGALLPAVAMIGVTLAIYFGAIALLAREGVLAAVLSLRSLALILLVGPLASLAALQLAVCVSSRVDDARTAQQVGALVILPVVGLFVAQLVGGLALTVPVLLVVALALVAVNGGLLWLAIRIFDRESILTRWR
jgi:ABC-2 type transport system permease protein